MSNFRQGRYSWLINPIAYAVDLNIINTMALLYFFPKLPKVKFTLIISTAWILTALIAKFYEVHRYSSAVRIFNLIVRQGLFFTLIMFAFIGIFPQYNISPEAIVNYIFYCIVVIAIFKYSLFFLLKKYRAFFKGNIRRTIILGESKQAMALAQFFKSTPELGYVNTNIVSFKPTAQVDLEALFEFIRR